MAVGGWMAGTKVVSEKEVKKEKTERERRKRVGAERWVVVVECGVDSTRKGGGGLFGALKMQRNLSLSGGASAR